MSPPNDELDKGVARLSPAIRMMSQPGRIDKVSDLWSNWRELLEAAQEYKLLRYPKAEITSMGAKLRKCNPRMDPKLLEMGAVALCAVFLSDYPIITATYAGDKELFTKYCCCNTKRNFNVEDPNWRTKADRLWWLLEWALLPVLRLIRLALSVSPYHQILFSGMSCNSLDELMSFLPNIKNNGTLTQLKSWIKSLDVALHFSTPNEGLPDRMNLMQRRLIRRGLGKEIITRHGLVLITVARGISVDRLATNRSENEFWLTGEDKLYDMQVAQDREEIESMFESVKPIIAYGDVEKLSQSNRWVALLNCIPQRDRKNLSPDQCTEKAEPLKALIKGNNLCKRSVSSQKGKNEQKCIDYDNDLRWTIPETPYLILQQVHNLFLKRLQLSLPRGMQTEK